MRTKFLLKAGLIISAFLNTSWSASTLGRTYSFGFEKGNLVRNWSFEQRADNWFDESWGSTQVVTARYLAKSSSLVATSGSYVGRFSGTNSAASTTKAFKTDLIPVEPGSNYTISFFMWSVSNTSGVTATMDFYSDNGSTLLVSQPGADYFVSTNSWFPYNFNVTAPTNARFAQICLINAGAGKGGTFYFDDVMMEKGNVSTPRDRVSEGISFWDDQGQSVQSQVKITGGGNLPSSRKYVVTSEDFDAMRRPFKQYAPYINSGTPDMDIGFDAKAKAYNNGSNGMTSLDAYPYSESDYADEPGNRLNVAHQSGTAWQPVSQNNDPRAIKGDFSFVDDLTIPASIENPSASANEPPYTYSWSKDVEGRYSLSWKDREGNLVQQAANLSGRWVTTHYQYYANGKLKSVLSPLDDPSNPNSQSYRQVTNYNSMGEVTSTYTADRGLQKYFYNRLGQIRFVQRLQYQPNLYSFTDYDAQNRPLSSGEQFIDSFDPSMSEDLSTASTIKHEHIGYIYDDLSSFANRIGFPISDIVPSSILLAQNGLGRLVCDYRLNDEVGYTYYSKQRKFVATFYNYNQYGEVSDSYKYVGLPGSLSNQILHAQYSYDEAHRLVNILTYDNGSTPVLVNQRKLTFDALGRVSQITGMGNKFISGYTYYDWGGLKTVILGGSGLGADGTRLDFAFHGHGWVKEIKATKQSTGEVIFQQFLGYEDKSNGATSVPAPLQSKFDGSISQQLYKYATDVLSKGPVRLTNYQYDDLGRMITADSKINGNANPLDALQQIDFANLQFSETEDQDSRMQYDDLGRITKNQSGVSAADVANYTYQAGSYELYNVTGKLSNLATRDASAPNTFVYDDLGRLTEDHSKKLTIHYGWDDMPLDFTVNNPDGTQTTEYEYYDASGSRVSRAQVKYTSFSNPVDEVEFIGNQESGEPDGMYWLSDIQAAINRWNYVCSNTCDFSQLTLYYIPDRGKTSTLDMGFLDATMAPIRKGDGTFITVKIIGILKDSRAYSDLLSGYFRGTLVSTITDFNLTGPGDRRWKEIYTNGVFTGTATTGLLGASGAVIGRINSSGQYEYFIKNHQGSTMKAVDDDGSFQSSKNSTYDYLSYGDPRKLKEGPDKVAEGYTGKEHDDDLTRLTYFGARWLDPELGMWMSPDAINVYSNPYAFGGGKAGGDPINYTDPDGNCPICLAVWVTFVVASVACDELSDACHNYIKRGGDAITRNTNTASVGVSCNGGACSVTADGTQSNPDYDTKTPAQKDKDAADATGTAVNKYYENRAIEQDVNSLADKMTRIPFTGTYEGMRYLNGKLFGENGGEDRAGDVFTAVLAGASTFGNAAEELPEGGGVRTAGSSGSLTEDATEITKRLTRSGEKGLRIVKPDKIIDITPKRVKEFIPEPRSPSGFKPKKFEDAIPGTKGMKRIPTQEELDQLNRY